MGRICLIVGTRPEIIKVAPILLEFKRQGFTDYLLINTGQHKELANPYWALFGLEPHYNLNVMAAGSTLGELTSRAFHQLDKLFSELLQEGNIDVILAQGDTTTVMVSSVIAFYRNIPFAHLEAGLRSFDLNNPFPEEFNRKVASIVTKLHLAPTELAKQNLIKEGVSSDAISVVGNTVVDALKFVTTLPVFTQANFTNAKLTSVFALYKEHVLITCHRRENHGANLLELIKAVTKLAKQDSDTLFIWPVHPNPNVKVQVEINSDLKHLPNVFLTEPLEYLDVLKVLSQCKIVISDSGGIQEEAPSFKVPVLVMRLATERTEAITAGVSKIVECTAESICHEYYNFRPDFPEDFVNPFGDGRAASRITKSLIEFRD
jgi:UDP-N-acetylglucosamine 2-epimerase (non-hydrolysing)